MFICMPPFLNLPKKMIFLCGTDIQDEIDKILTYHHMRKLINNCNLDWNKPVYEYSLDDSIQK